MYFGGDVYWFCTVSDFLFIIFLIVNFFLQFYWYNFSWCCMHEMKDLLQCGCIP
jgi:hypothetical protein